MLCRVAGSRKKLSPGGKVRLPTGERADPSAPMVLVRGRAEAGGMNFASTVGTVGLAALAIGVTACGGDDGGGEATAQRPATATTAAAEARPAAEDLGRYLMRRGEEPGFRPGAAPGATPAARETITGVEALVSKWGLTAADERRLIRDGFISFTSGPIRAPGSAGVTNVALYETPEGARRSLAHDLRPDVIRAEGPVANLRFFRVSGLPGARGWTATIPGEPASHAVGNVLWVQGRCVHTLGNQGPGPFAGSLSRGARSIYDRTSDRCPCAKS
jgi:hypothetical protein